MEARPLISLVTTTLDQPGPLGRTLRSVAGRGVELVVVERGGAAPPEGDDVLGVAAPGLAEGLALDRGVALARGDILAVVAPGTVMPPGSLELVARLAALFPEMAWLSSTQPVVAAEDGRLAPTFLPGLARAAFLDGAYGPPGPGFAGAIQTAGTFWRRALWREAEGTFAQGAFGLWARFFERAEPCAVLATLAVSPPAAPEDEAAILAEWRERAGHRTTVAGANGFRVHTGRFISAEPSLVEAPFVVIDGEGPARGLKDAIAEGRIA